MHDGFITYILQCHSSNKKVSYNATIHQTLLQPGIISIFYFLIILCKITQL